MKKLPAWEQVISAVYILRTGKNCGMPISLSLPKLRLGRDSEIGENLSLRPRSI